MSIEAGPHQARKRSSGCAKLCAFGCAGFVLMLLLCGLIFYMFYTHFTSAVLAYRSDTYLQSTSISESHKQVIRAQRDRLLAAYEAGTISDQQLLDLGKTLYNHPLFPAFVRLSVEADILPDADLDQEQQRDLLKQLSRLTLAMNDARIDGQQYMMVIKPLIEYQGEGSLPAVKSTLSDDDLLKVSASARALADHHQIPDAFYNYDFNAALTAWVDTAMQSGDL